MRFSFFKGDQAFAAKIHPGHAVHQEDHRVSDWQVSVQQNCPYLLFIDFLFLLNKTKAILGSTFNGLIGMTNMSTFLDLMTRVPLNPCAFEPVWNILKTDQMVEYTYNITKKDQNLYFLKIIVKFNSQWEFSKAKMLNFFSYFPFMLLETDWLNDIIALYFVC